MFKPKNNNKVSIKMTVREFMDEIQKLSYSSLLTLHSKIKNYSIDLVSNEEKKTVESIIQNEIKNRWFRD